jgi:predicted Zn-dependent protease with MMP-like domain
MGSSLVGSRYVRARATGQSPGTTVTAPCAFTGYQPSSNVAGKITIFRLPLERHYGANLDTLRLAIRRVVLHEIAHHFGISDARLRELDRY